MTKVTIYKEVLRNSFMYRAWKFSKNLYHPAGHRV